MSDLYQHVKSDKVKWVLTLVAFIIVAVMLAGIICGWFERKEETKELPAEVVADGGMVVGNTQSNGVALMSAKIMSAEYEDYGVNALADTAYTLTATIEPSDATNKAVDYTAAWKNSNSAWASGKNVADYVTVQQASDGSLNATVTCLKAFGEQVIITCAVRDNVDAYATCTVDYEQKYLGADISITGHDLTDTTVNWNISHDNQDASVGFPTLKNMGSFDQNWIFAWCNVGTSGGTGTYGSYSVNQVYSDVYTIGNEKDSYSMGVCITQEYYDILKGLGYTLKVSPEEYIGFNVDGQLSIGNLILGYWSNNTFSNYTAYVNLRSALKSHAGQAMFRIKCAPSEADIYTSEAKVYNVSFSASSFSSILADSVSLNNSAIIF